MSYDYLSLADNLSKYVLWLGFYRRRPPGRSVYAQGPYRRMIATNCPAILNSLNGKMSLNYREAHQPPAYDYAAKGLIPAWDVIVRDYRMIPTEEVEIEFKADITNFWEIFNISVAPMSSTQMYNFMSNIHDPNIIPPDTALEMINNQETQHMASKEDKKKDFAKLRRLSNKIHGPSNPNKLHRTIKKMDIEQDYI